ncbi:DUF2141 domain-containing protein [Winogradskyella undariae]|uniref:DUF2141 domain-containing protein n=1 Tax=Winogradskyella undariae TaxID=1285465 RepID=UPI00156BB711|nr:DUF2141 domain-containing protein [Winogradskyella undariae]NRR90504.1 DUF2141 domain-containing protein [Winogradskyella undariae]
MNILVKMTTILIICFLSFPIEAQDNLTITIIVDEAASNDGKMFIALYNTETDFLKKPFKNSISVIENNSSTVVFNNIPQGTYGISVFHDENDNGIMDTNFMHIPKEAYGCSNDAKGFMGPPKWSDAKFQMKENKTITISI